MERLLEAMVLGGWCFCVLVFLGLVWLKKGLNVVKSRPVRP